MAEKLEKTLKKIGDKLSYITFSGNGEPTSHSDFPEIVEKTKKVRDENSNAKIALLSNSSRLVEEEILETVNKIDYPLMKLDVGSEEKFEKINRPCNVNYSDIVNALKKVDELYLQSIKFEVEFTNMDGDLKDWIKIVSELEPREIQLYTLDRQTHRKLEKINDIKLIEIQETLNEKGIVTNIY